MKLSRTAHRTSVRALVIVIVIAAVAGIAGLLITAGPGASAQTGSAHARSAPGGAPPGAVGVHGAGVAAAASVLIVQPLNSIGSTITRFSKMPLSENRS